MKKNLFLITCAAIGAAGAIFSSCQTAPSTKVDLKTEADSISYAFGASISEGLESNLQQMGILADTLRIQMEYSARINNEQDAEKVKTLNKELRHKIDSINKANAHNLLGFLQGFKEGLNASSSKDSYNVGISFGSQVAQQYIPQVTNQFLEGKEEAVNKKAILAAVSASIQNKAHTMAQASAYLNVKSQQVYEAQMAERAKASEENIAVGTKFMEENKTKEGIVALESGIQYKVIKEGNGAKPKATDTVVCNYKGELLDGTVFDSSEKHGEAATFPLQGVIPGWTEVLQLMPVGSKWEVYIPYNLAYGEQGSGQVIPPYSTLKFEIELLDIK